ncbi:RNA-binding protein [Nostoc sp. MBR 210]|nr:RNA-binding protein [Nostoc sp. MBR 210]
MSLKSVNDILGCLEQQARWQEQPFQKVLHFWAEVVGAVAAKHTQPIMIQRDVLRVATSSAAWAQNLAFKRQIILLRLNPNLPAPLVDIRFSTAGWQNSSAKPQPTTNLPQEHPSYLGKTGAVQPDAAPAQETPETAFGEWAKKMQMRSHNLPLCPQCQSPTPPGELHRWQVCAICASKQFQNLPYS